FSLGIDLGTSNCAMAVADNDSDSTEVLLVTQIVAANQVGEMRTFPSSLYLPHPDEFPAGSFRLPWDAAGPGIVGQFARDRRAQPDRGSGPRRRSREGRAAGGTASRVLRLDGAGWPAVAQ